MNTPVIITAIQLVNTFDGRDGKSVWLHVSCKFDSYANRHYVNMNLLKK